MFIHKSQTSGERLQDHWSSGLRFCSAFVDCTCVFDCRLSGVIIITSNVQLLKAYRIKFQKFAAHAHKDALINETFIPK